MNLESSQLQEEIPQTTMTQNRSITYITLINYADMPTKKRINIYAHYSHMYACGREFMPPYTVCKANFHIAD